MPVESGRKPSGVRIQSVSENRFRCEPGGDERLVDAVARERVDEPGRISDEQDAATCGNGSRATHRQPVPANVGQRAQAHSVCVREPPEVIAQPRPFASPPSDPEVRVITLREHPAVAAGYDAKLDNSCARDGSGLELPVRHVRFECHTVDDARVEPHRARDDPVGTICADERVCLHHASVHPHRDAGLAVLDLPDSSTITKVRARRRRLLREMRVEPPPLRHEDERLRVPAREALPVPEPDPEAVDDVLDDRVDGAWRVAQRPPGEPASARLVPREAGAVGQENPGSGAREAQSRCRAGGAGTDDEHVEPLHPGIVGANRSGLQCRARRSVPGLFQSLFRRPKPTGPPEVLRRFTASDRPIAESGVTVEADGFRIDAGNEGSVPLFEIPDPEVDGCVLAYRAMLKTENVEGGVYLELWCRVPGRGEFFSKGLHDKLRGTTDWSSHEIPFLLKKGQRPDLIKLNVAFEGPGTAWIRDVELLQTPLA